jgi:hypothetical protein
MKFSYKSSENGGASTNALPITNRVFNSKVYKNNDGIKKFSYE